MLVHRTAREAEFVARLTYGEGMAASTTSAVVDLAPPVVGSLSPSRASDFMACPLLYRFRVIDKLPERPSPAAVRGTVVHSALERLFDLPAADRTLASAEGLVGPAWTTLLEERPELAELFLDGDLNSSAEALTPEAFLAGARDLLAGYFALEDPQRLEPASREQYVEVVIEGGLRLRGYVDRIDEAPGDLIRVVDYKTGRAPSETFEAKALFQMKFYALVLWRTRGVVPRELRLLYLGDRTMLRYAPEEAELVSFERKVVALWHAIERATETGDWRPNVSRLCDWCDHRGTRCTAHPIDAERAAAYDAWLVTRQPEPPAETVDLDP
ncbi:MAG: putative RecB family exonuclease [Frankiales bacterium]|nr:putative RecB family exonuclease [Frankiales bacterium]